MRAVHKREASIICPNCKGPTFFSPNGFTHPSPALGNPVAHLPANVESLYEEARRASSAGCHTGAVLLCRKILMNVAVEQGAEEGQQFIQYIEYLASKGYVPPNGRLWVDRIREKGNEATHEIQQMTADDARMILGFTQMLLKFVYEFPAIAARDAESQPT